MTVGWKEIVDHPSMNTINSILDINVYFCFVLYVYVLLFQYEIQRTQMLIKIHFFNNFYEQSSWLPPGVYFQHRLLTANPNLYDLTKVYNIC